MKNIDTSILEVLSSLSSYFGKDYCFPSQNTLLDLLRTLKNKIMSRRTLCRHLKTLEEEGLIKRKRRLSAGPDGKPIFASTLYTILSAGWRMLKKQVLSLMPMIKRFLKRSDLVKEKARTFVQALKPESPPLSYDEGRVRWKKLLSSLG